MKTQEIRELASNYIKASHPSIYFYAPEEGRVMDMIDVLTE